MKCSNCGGELILENGIGICTSCGSNHKIDHIFENTEVYLCYIENDEQGRRTKDSIIAANIYQKLESKKVNVFYERISTSNAAGDDLITLKYHAINNAKIVLIIGTQPKHFEKLLIKHSEHLKNKKIIPLYSEMRPEVIPAELQKLQALNYDAIGSDADMIKGILNLLGRKQELELAEHSSKSRKNKMVAIIISLCISLIAIVTCLMFFLTRPSVEDKSTQLSSQQIYDNAQGLMGKGKYIEAADLFKTISHFKNSSNFIKIIYDRYDGYYQTDNTDILFYINIQNGETADIILERTFDGNKKVKFEESATITDNAFNLSFTDTQSNIGKIEITLKNEVIAIKTVVDAVDNNLSIGNIDLVFALDQRTDSPEAKEISKETIMEWMANKTTLSELKQAGYEIEFEETMTAGGGTFEHAKMYRIANTDIKLLMMDFDLSKTNDGFKIEENRLEDYIVTLVIAPAEIIAPSNIGKSTKPYIKNNTMFVLNTDPDNLWFNSWSGSEYCPCFEFDEENFGDLHPNSFVGITSIYLMGEYNFANMFDAVSKDYLFLNCRKIYSTSKNKSLEDVDYRWIEEKEEKFLIATYTSDIETIAYYVGNIQSLEIKLIKEITLEKYPDYAVADEIWKNYPELFEEFFSIN